MKLLPFLALAASACLAADKPTPDSPSEIEPASRKQSAAAVAVSPPVTPAAFLDLLAKAGANAATISRIRTTLPADASVTRAQACHALYAASAP